MNSSKLLNAASVVALTTLVGIRALPADTIIAVRSQGPDEASFPMCDPTQLGTADADLIANAEGSQPGALATALQLAQSDTGKLASTLAFMLDRYRSQRELVVTTFAAVFPDHTVAVTAAALGCNCSDLGNDLEEIAALLNAIIEAVPGSFPSVLEYASQTCAPELAGLLIAPPTATVPPPVVVVIENEDPPGYG